jgi:hypothetical protein
MASTSYSEIKDSLRQLYVEDPRPWLIGFSGGKDSTLVAALVFDAVMSIPPEQRTKPITVLCTDTRVEIPAIAEGVEIALDRMRRCSQQQQLNVEAHLLKPPPEQSFWVNIIGRRFPSLKGKVSLVVTSPPYLNVTRYEEDQWLRLWFLGGEAQPTYGKVSKDDRHNSAIKHWQFLTESWKGVAPLLKRSATVIVRHGAISLDEKEMTDQLTATIRAAFPRSRMLTRPKRSQIVRRQANNFLPTSKGCRYEMDFVFSV